MITEEVSLRRLSVVLPTTIVAGVLVLAVASLAARLLRRRLVAAMDPENLRTA